MTMRVAALDASLLPALAALFEACACTCHCRYWHFGGNKNEWLARCAFEAGENEREQADLVRAGDPASGGLVALEGDEAVGWMKLAPREALPKLRRLPVYRARDLGDGARVFSVGCFLVHPAHRRRGVAGALLDAAPDHVRAVGGVAIEAYPRRSADELREDEAWMGYERLFLQRGYAELPGGDAIPQYPVLRLSLDAT
jgi:GNAT superfamily N-acetyltransferase